MRNLFILSLAWILLALHASAVELDPGFHNLEITVSDNLGSPSIMNYLFEVRYASPRISNIVVSSITNAYAKITWDTDLASNSTVKYGKASATYDSIEADATATRRHSVELILLSGETTYFYLVQSCNTYGCMPSTERSFTTPPDGTDRPPMVSLNFPTNGTSTYATKFSFNCSGEDDKNLTSIELFGDVYGAYQQLQQIPVTGKNATIIFPPITLEPGTYNWNCRATDNGGQTSFAPNNFAFTVMPTIYNFTIVPENDSFEISNSNNSFAIRPFILNNTGNQAIMVVCDSQTSWVTVYECEEFINLMPGEWIVLHAAVNATGIPERIYQLEINFGAMPEFMLKTAGLRVNVTSDPNNPIPAISGLNYSASYSSAVIFWNTTGVGSNASVYFGLDEAALSFVKGIDENAQFHSVAIESLSPQTIYYFKVESCSLGGCRQSGIHSFSTSAIPPGCAYGNPACEPGYACQANECVAIRNGCSNCGSPGGPSGPGNPPKGSPTQTKMANASASPSTIPTNVQIIKLRTEIDGQIYTSQISEAALLEVRQLLAEAELLQKQGKSEQALVLLNRAKSKLTEYGDKSKNTKASFTWQIALLVLVLLVSAAIYYAYTLRKIKVVEIKPLEIEKPKNP
jgi:hypothetical protein